MFEALEKLFNSVREFSASSKDIVTLATATGSLVLVYFTARLTYHIVAGLRLYGKWAVISGSTDGIGLAMARELARRGHSIVVIGRNEEKLANTKLSLEGEPNVGEVVTVKIDLSDSSLENYDRIRAQIDPDNRDIGILINNAGIFPAQFRRYNNYDMDYLRTIVNVNVLATAYLTRMIMPGMLERGKGLVANVSSGLGAVTGPYISLYSPTKAFLDSFSRQLQMEYSSHPVDIINLTPGPVHTKLFTSTSSISNPSIVNPTPEDYARSAINALATRINFFSGNILHGIVREMAIFAESVGLIHFVIKMNHRMNAKDFSLSPVMRRRDRLPLSSQAADGGQSVSS